LFPSQLALFAIPISVYIAATRSNLLDVDRLVSSTAAYTLLLVGLGAAALTVLPWLARVASERAGMDATLAQLGLAVLVAFAAIRLEPFVRPHVERVFPNARRCRTASGACQQIRRPLRSCGAAPSSASGWTRCCIRSSA
jgi:hypothetical protein